MSEIIIFNLDNITTLFEDAILTVYIFIKSKPPCHIIFIYIVLYFLLTKFINIIKRKDYKINYKIIDEQNEDSIDSVVKNSIKELISTLDNIKKNKETDRKPEYSKKFEITIKEISMMQDMYSEFQDEIIDSHQSIISSFRLPVMK
ncbi:hypothetical protein SteCoe_16444 [Stentor coeruleus]|uniref:Uncharacterized protein n=1 Tax=Stentor coeruleus TaxID=5963 RepID=A0A1R2C127_9CILI|nr:hypothetical protein SteCoe_16444 [Stentor coeruleus]